MIYYILLNNIQGIYKNRKTFNNKKQNLDINILEFELSYILEKVEKSKNQFLFNK